MTIDGKKNINTDEPVLDQDSHRQLQMELYGSGLVDDSAATQTNNNNINLTGGMIVMGASILGLVGMQFPFLFIKHAPFMATPGRKIRHALQFIERKKDTLPSVTASASTLSSRSSSTSPPVFVDLGSGDGQAVYEAARLGYKAIGVEFNWTLWALSSLRRQFFWSSEVKR